MAKKKKVSLTLQQLSPCSKFWHCWENGKFYELEPTRWGGSSISISENRISFSGALAVTKWQGDITRCTTMLEKTRKAV